MRLHLSWCLGLPGRLHHRILPLLPVWNDDISVLGFLRYLVLHLAFHLGRLIVILGPSTAPVASPRPSPSSPPAPCRWAATAAPPLSVGSGGWGSRAAILTLGVPKRSADLPIYEHAGRSQDAGKDRTSDNFRPVLTSCARLMRTTAPDQCGDLPCHSCEACEQQAPCLDHPKSQTLSFSEVTRTATPV